MTPPPHVLWAALVGIVSASGGCADQTSGKSDPSLPHDPIFAAVRTHMSHAQVRQLYSGVPYETVIKYPFGELWFSGDELTGFFEPGNKYHPLLTGDPLRRGMSREEVERAVGKSKSYCELYHRANYVINLICYLGESVVDKGASIGAMP